MRRNLTLALFCAALMFWAVACDFSKTESAPPTAPPLPVVPSNDSVVEAKGDGACPETGPCIADYSVTLKTEETVSWVFTGASPPTSTIQAGSVKWGAPGPHRWTSKVCNADLCKDAGGVVSFTEDEAP
jgi:hypothetical protein